MKLNTYRCGCGRIEPLPHPKARPGPCVHKALPDVELTPWRPVDVRMPPGWAVTEALVRQRGDEVFVLLARKRGRKDVGLAYAREKPHMRRPALDVLRRTCAAQQQRAEGFFAALRGLIKQLNFARAGGMRPWTEPVVLRTADEPLKVSATALRTAACPKHWRGVVSLPHGDGARACAAAEQPRVVGAACPAPYGTTVKTSAVPYSAGYIATPLAPRAQHAICRWRTDVRGADQLRYAKAAQMYAEGLHQRGLGAYVLTTQIRGMGVVRVAFDSKAMEDTWISEPVANYRLDLENRIQAATSVALGTCTLLDVPGKRPAWFSGRDV